MLASEGMHLHGFGVKTAGLRSYAADLTSADSMAWSLRGRHQGRCQAGHATEANCPKFALAWRAQVLACAEGSQQLALPFPPTRAVPKLVP